MFAIIRFIYLLNRVLRNFTPSSSSQCNQTVESIPKRIAIGAHQTYNVLGEISLHHPNSSNAFLPAEGGVSQTILKTLDYRQGTKPTE